MEEYALAGMVNALSFFKMSADAFKADVEDAAAG